MGPVFFDTWGWVAIVHQEDEYHEKAAKWYKEFLAEDPIVITSDRHFHKVGMGFVLVL